MSSEREIYTAVEIGTSSIKVLLAEFLPGDYISVLGYGEADSLKMCKAEAINTSVVGEQLRIALNNAEKDAGIPITEPVFMSISGSFIESVKVNGTVDIISPDERIQENDLAEAIRQTNKIQQVPGKFELSQSVNKFFRLADGRVMFNPIGQCSATLEVETQHFLADSQRANTSCCLLSEALGSLSISQIIYTPLAVSSAVFHPDINESTLNIVIDIGAGMTSIAVPTPVGYFHLEQIPIGCDHIANDLSIALDLPIQTTRALLCQMREIHCSAIATKDGNAREVSVHQYTQGKHRLIPASSIETIIELRLTELFDTIKRRLNDNNAYVWLGNTITLSGGGARIPQITDLAKSIFNRQVIVGQAYKITGKNNFEAMPQHNTIIGLLRSGRRFLQINQEVAEQASLLTSGLNWWKNVCKAILDW